MTYKELLNSVTFEDVAKQIVRFYPDMEPCLGWYKIHFDMLRSVTPKYHEGSNADVCHITMEDWEDGSGLHLDAYPMEGDLWEHSLTKELILSPDVKASNEDLAACCLWHTSFYGFTDAQVMERLHIDSDGKEYYEGVWDDILYSRYKAKENFAYIRKHGGHVPSLRELSPNKRKELKKKVKEIFKSYDLRANGTKRKSLFRLHFMDEYYQRMMHISNFIVKSIPALSFGRNYLSVEELCGLFKSDLFGTVLIPSYAEENEDSATYLLRLIRNYDMLPKANNVVLYMARGHEYDVLAEDGVTHQYIRNEERQLYNAVCEIVGQAENVGTGDLIVDVIPELGRQTLIWVAAYNGKPIAEEEEYE